jgi:hypothetical protein
LPHYFMEFDCYDRQRDCFLSTPRRRELLAGTPFIASVAVLYSGLAPPYAELIGLVSHSHFISADPQAILRQTCVAQGIDPARTIAETDPTGLMEGLYIKAETNDTVVGRYKYVRGGFLQTVFDAESHWLDRPIIPNRLRADIDLFA